MSSEAICIVCKEGLQIKPARGRKSGKPFLMFVCPVDGRHFRGFITDQEYLKRLTELGSEVS